LVCQFNRLLILIKEDNINVLIAEDNPLVQALHERTMKKWKYNFDMASNGIEAVGYAERNKGKYDFCLMDIEMPKMNGIEATRMIREKVSYFPIVALSANYDYKRQCQEVGMDDFLERPCSPSVLLEKIKTIIVKLYSLTFGNNGFVINEEMPVNSQHAKELRELAKDDLCKLNIRGVGEHDLIVLVHKNVPYKISHDFVGKGEGISIFLDRSNDTPGECHLYKSSRPMPSIFLQSDEYERKKQEEDELLKGCVTMALKKYEE